MLNCSHPALDHCEFCSSHILVPEMRHDSPLAKSWTSSAKTIIRSRGQDHQVHATYWHPLTPHFFKKSAAASCISNGHLYASDFYLHSSGLLRICVSRFECPIPTALTSILATSFATILVLIVFAVQGLKLTHALIHSALCVLDRSIVLIWYFPFINYIKPFNFKAKF